MAFPLIALIGLTSVLASTEANDEGLQQVLDSRIERILDVPTTAASANRLTDMLFSSEKELRAQAAETFGRHVGRFDGYMATLHSLAFDVVGRRGTPYDIWVRRTVKGLERLASGTDRESAHFAITALARATPTIQARLAMSGCEVGINRPLSTEAERALARLAKSRSKGFLVQLLESRDPQLLWRVSEALLSAGPQEAAIQRLKGALADPSPEIRAVAALELSYSLQEDAYPVLRRTIRNTDPLVIAAIDDHPFLSEKQVRGLLGRNAGLTRIEKDHLLILSSRYPAASLLVFRLALQDGDPKVRECAQDQLWRFSDVLSAQERDQIVAGFSGYSFVRHEANWHDPIKQQVLREASLACLSRPEPEVQAAGIVGLGRLKDAAHLPRVMDRVRSTPSPFAYGALVEYLFEIGAEGLPATRELIGSPEAVQRNVALLVCRYRLNEDPAGLGDAKWIVAALRDVDESVRLTALTAAEHRNMVELIPDIEKLSDDPSEAVRLQCISTLAAVGSGRREESLGRLARAGNEQIRELASAALRGNNRRRALSGDVSRLRPDRL